MMKSSILVLVLLIVSTLVKGQEKGIQFGLLGSFESNSYKFKQNEFSSVIDYESINAYSIGLNFENEFSNKVFIKSGLFYSNQGYIVKYNWITSDGTTGDPLIPKEIEVSISMLEIPVKVGYEAIKLKDFAIKPTTGLQIGIIMNSTEKTTYGDNSTQNTDDHIKDNNAFQVGLCFDLGFTYDLAKNIEIAAIPYVKKGLIPLNASMTSGQFSCGCSFGLNFGF